MTNYTWTDNMMRSGSTCDVDKVADNLMHLKYNAGGLLPVNNLGTVTSNITLDPNKIDVADITASITISLPTTGFISGVENKCILNFTTTNASSPILPTGLKWSDKSKGVVPSAYSTLSGVRNVLVFTTYDGGTTWEAEYATYGVVEVPFVQPTLSANGTLGGVSFAVAASNHQHTSDYDYDAWHAFDGITSGQQNSYGASSVPFDYIIYNPNPLKISNIQGMNIYAVGYCVLAATVFGSNDNLTWRSLTSFTNSSTAVFATWNITIPTNQQNYYNYYKISGLTAQTNAYGTCGIQEFTLTATYIATI